MIQDKPPPGFRPEIPLGVMVVLLRRLLARLGVPEVHIDHRPPISERKFDTEKRDTIPPANDPAHLEALTPAEHDLRTHGLGGERRITTAGSDTGRRKKARRIEKKGDGEKVAWLRRMREQGR